MTDTISVRVDAKLKRDASKLADKLGVSFGTIFSVYLKQFLREKRLVIQDYDDAEWTADLEKQYLQAKNDYKK
jgi:antitoxin component of RelBE/YafQ-DinJ toxin-antitoxin module